MPVIHWMLVTNYRVYETPNTQWWAMWHTWLPKYLTPIHIRPATAMKLSRACMRLWKRPPMSVVQQVHRNKSIRLASAVSSKIHPTFPTHRGQVIAHETFVRIIWIKLSTATQLHTLLTLYICLWLETGRKTQLRHRAKLCNFMLLTAIYGRARSSSRERALVHIWTTISVLVIHLGTRCMFISLIVPSAST